MSIYLQIVAVAEGLTVIFGLLMLVIKPFREKITKEKEKAEAIQKNFNGIRKEIGSLKTDIDTVNEAVQEEKARHARVQILRFADEIYCRQKHSKEHFDEILDSITFYNEFCDAHPKFKNARTQHAQQRINEVYKKCQREHSFLGDEQ